MRFRIIGLAAVLALSVATAPGAQAQNKFALIIGNKNYKAQVGPLTNPINDASLVSDALKGIGFRTTLVTDGDRTSIHREVSKLARALGEAGDGAIGFFYYSGHGVSRPLERSNYLIPVDIDDVNDPDIWWKAVSLDWIVEEFQRHAPNAAHFLIFDACRSELRVGTRGATKSFSPIVQQNGVFIATSTGPNATASDGPGHASGPYARALAIELQRPRQPHLILFQNVKSQVAATTNPRQVAWETNGLIDAVYLNANPDGPRAAATVVPPARPIPSPPPVVNLPAGPQRPKPAYCAPLVAALQGSDRNLNTFSSGLQVGEWRNCAVRHASPDRGVTARGMLTCDGPLVPRLHNQIVSDRLSEEVQACLGNEWRAANYESKFASHIRFSTGRSNSMVELRLSYQAGSATFKSFLDVCPLGCPIYDPN